MLEQDCHVGLIAAHAVERFGENRVEYTSISGLGRAIKLPPPVVGEMMLYVNKVGNDGWLQVRHRDSSALVSIPKYTQLDRLESRAGRTLFKVMDGASRGQVVSLADANATEFVGSRAPVQSPAQIVVTYGGYVEGWISEARGGQRLDQQMASLDVGGIRVAVTMNSVWGGAFTPMPTGQYAVLVPDAPHDAGMTRFYRRVAPGLRYDQVWFPIRYGDNSRFVHVGNLSEGCVTVLDLARWPDIHEALISHRSRDGTSVAQLVVSGAPERVR
jgi:hypothetical protein